MGATSRLTRRVLLARQGVVGDTQYALELPEGLVVLHVLGSALTWVAISRLYFATTRLVPADGELTTEQGDPAAAGRAGERSSA